VKFIRQREKTFKLVQKGINDTWKIDLIEMIPFWKENKSFRYLLTVIDTFSKYAYAEAVRTKSALDVAEAMKSIFKKSKSTRVKEYAVRSREKLFLFHF